MAVQISEDDKVVVISVYRNSVPDSLQSWLEWQETYRDIHHALTEHLYSCEVREKIEEEQERCKEVFPPEADQALYEIEEMCRVHGAGYWRMVG